MKITKYSRIFRVIMLGVFLGVSVFAQEPSQIDQDQDGIADFSPDSILIVLKDGVSPDAADASYFAQNRSRSELAKRSTRNAFGQFIGRLSSVEGLNSLRSLSVRRPSVFATRSSRPSSARHTMQVRIDASKINLKQAIARLAADPDVLQAEPDFSEKSELNDPYSNSAGAWGQSYADQWYLSAVSASSVWALVSTSAPEVVVAVIDSGVDPKHPDLSPVLWTNPNEIAGNGIDDDLNGYVDDTTGWNFQSRNNQTEDTYGHGTFVAGLIAAQAGNSFGIAGIAPGVRIMSLRNGESGSSYVSSSIEALYYAVNQRAQVVNMSFGGVNYSSAFAEAVRYAIDNGVVLVSSSGNEGSESYTHYPSGYPGVISVGAVDNTDQVASFSNYGPSVDLVAPGGGGNSFSGRIILGPRAANTTLGDVVDTFHVRSSGTSFSSPIVAGAAALLLRQTPSLSPSSVRQILCRSADDLESSGWSMKSSYGRLNIMRALQLESPGDAEISGAVNGQVVTGNLTVTGTAQGENFLEYVLEYGAGKTPLDWIVVSQSLSPVTEGSLGTWNTSSLTGGDYTLRLTVRCSGRPYAENRIAVFVGAKAPTSPSGWPKYGIVNPESPSVMDVNGDGVKEILLASGTGIYAYKPDGTSFGAGTYQGIRVWPSGPVSVGDIDGDGEMEIGAISKSGISSAYPEFHEVCFWNLDGTKCAGWPVSLVRDNDFVPHTLAPTVVDVDADGQCEVLFPSITAKGGLPRLHLVRGDGTPLPGWPKVLESFSSAFIHCTAGAADLDGDGSIDFVVADSSGRVHALNLNGQYLPGWPKMVSAGTHLSQEIVLTDLDRDGHTDVVACFYNGTVAVLDHKGNFKPGWPKNLGSIPRPPAIADLDGDGDLEMAIGTQDGKLNVLHHDGTQLPGWPKQVSSRIYSPSLTDLNNDGKIDLVASDGNRILHAWNVEGSYLSEFGFPFQLSGTFGCYSAPVVEDLDGDSKLELVVYGENLEVRSLSAIANPGIQPFSHMHCDPANTCRYILPGKIQKGQKFLVDRAGGISLDLSGYGLLSGSTAHIGNQSAAMDVVSSVNLNLTVPASLPEGWQNIWITNPNSSPIWLANAILVVKDLFGDTDHDGLSDLWEWEHEFDPLNSQPENSPESAVGDFDGDGIPNLIEEALAPMGMDPRNPDIKKMPALKLEQGKAVFDYSKDKRTQINLLLEWSPDLAQWFTPGEDGYPPGLLNIDMGTGTGQTENRRIELPLPQAGRGFFRWAAKRETP